MKMYAECTWCEQEMAPGNGCKDAVIESTDDTRLRLRFTVDTIRGDGRADDADDTCHDCNVKVWQFHHPGCDWELCPFCRGQLISCDCSVVLDFVD